MYNKKPTYYEILELKEDCSTKEIRESFVNMSKKFHPDKNSKDPGLHDRFVQINEAYSVLSKIHSRRNYDVDLRVDKIVESNRKYNSATGNSSSEQMDTPNYEFRWRDESIWSMRGRSNKKSYAADSYYGIKGVHRKPNSWIAAGAFVLMGVGALFHYIAYKQSRTFSVSQLNRRTLMLSEELEISRTAAAANGNDLQLKLLQQKCVTTEE